MPGVPVIEMTDVSFRYGSVDVLTNVNLRLSQGEFITVVGPNGGGKTSLLKLILGLLRPSHGAVTVFGTSPEAARLRIGYMPQESNLDLKFPVTVLEVAMMGMLGNGSRLGLPRRKDRMKATEALETVGLGALSARSISALSGGEKRRLLIARALACDPQLLVLDEPAANIDLLAEQEIMSVLRQMVPRITIVMSSHDLAFVSEHVDTVVCVNRTVAVHPTAKVSSETFKEVFGKDLKIVLHDKHFQEEGKRTDELL